MPEMSSKKDPAAAKAPEPAPAPATDAAASKKKETIAGAEGHADQEAKLVPPENKTAKAAKG